MERGLWRLGVRFVVYPKSENFSKHSENLREIQAALRQMERTHKRAIREGDEPSEHALRKVHVLLVGVFAEASLRKIVDDPTGFNDRERRLIWRNSRQDDRWVAAVEFAARRHYAVPVHREIEDVAPAATSGRIQSVVELLKGELSSVITDRNKLAHGQWVWQLKSRSDDQFLSVPTVLDYNYVAIEARSRMIGLIAQIVHAFAVSEPTFDRDYAKLSLAIDCAKTDLDGRRYIEFAKELKRTRRVVASADREG